MNVLDEKERSVRSKYLNFKAVVIAKYLGEEKVENKKNENKFEDEFFKIHYTFNSNLDQAFGPSIKVTHNQKTVYEESELELITYEQGNWEREFNQLFEEANRLRNDKIDNIN